MLASVAALLVALTAPAPPAWVAQHQCVVEPAADLACGADPVPNATTTDLGACACDLLTAAGLSGCDELRDNDGRTLTIEPKLARAKSGQPALVAAIGALSAMRLLAMTEREFTVDEFTDHTLKRTVEDILHEMPVAEMLYETAELGLMPPTLESLVALRAQRALHDIPAATATCRRLLASIKAPQSPESIRDDLVCSIARAEPSVTPLSLAPRWPWCAGCSANGWGLPYEVPSTNVRYPAIFDVPARALDTARSTNAIGWACVTTRQPTPALQFGNAPIAVEVTTSLRKFATLVSLSASPYVVEEIAVGSCADIQVEPALKQGRKLTLAQLTNHGGATSCDIERIGFRSPDGKRIDVDFRADSLAPDFRERALGRGIRQFYRDLVDEVRGVELGVDRKRDVVILAVLTRKALQEAGFVVFDPVLGLGHHQALHVETNPAPAALAALGKRFDAMEMADWLAGKALERTTNRQIARAKTNPIADLNRAIAASAPKRDVVDPELVRISITGTSKDPFANLTTREDRPWCVSGPTATVRIDFVTPAPAFELDAFTKGTLTVVADGKPWAQPHSGHFVAPARDLVRSLTLEVKAPKRACLHFALLGRHTGEAGGLHDLDVQRVTRTDDLPTLRPFVAEIAQALANCDGAALGELVHLPLTIETRTYKTPRELLRACRLDELPRPIPELDLVTDGVTASQQFDEWLIGSASWQYKVERGRWRLVGVRAGTASPD